MLDEGLGVGGGATYFLTSLLDHPDFTDEHLALMPFAGLGGSTVPVAVTRAGDPPRHQGVPLVRQHRAPVDHRLPRSTSPRSKRLTTDGRAAARRRDPPRRRGRDPRAGVPTAASATPTPRSPPRSFDDDGWYRTGDVGVLDDDGYLTITDRVSDIIIRGGENISAQEIEELLLGLDGVAEVSVVAAPDERLGERAAAVVRLRDGAAGARRSTTCGPTSPPPAWPSRSGPSRSTRSPTSPARRRARSRSSGSASSCADGDPGNVVLHG